MWHAGGVSDEDRLSRAQARTIIGRVFKMAAPFRKTIYLSFACVMVTTATTLSAPIIVRHGIDAGIRAKNSGELNKSVVLYLIAVSLTYSFGRLLFVFVNRTGESFLRVLRLAVFRQMQRQSMAFFDRNKAGVLVARMTADIESMSELVQFGLLQFLSASLMLVFSVVVLLALSWQLTIVAFLVMPVLVLASIKFLTATRSH